MTCGYVHSETGTHSVRKAHMYMACTASYIAIDILQSTLVCKHGISFFIRLARERE